MSSSAMTDNRIDADRARPPDTIAYTPAIPAICQACPTSSPCRLCYRDEASRYLQSRYDTIAAGQKKKNRGPRPMTARAQPPVRLLLPPRCRHCRLGPWRLISVVSLVVITRPTLVYLANAMLCITSTRQLLEMQHGKLGSARWLKRQSGGHPLTRSESRASSPSSPSREACVCMCFDSGPLIS